MEYIELNWLCKHLKKVRGIQAAILVLNWVKHSFSLWISLNSLTLCLQINIDNFFVYFYSKKLIQNFLSSNKQKVTNNVQKVTSNGTSKK